MKIKKVEDMMIKNSSGEYETVKEPIELIQITGILTDEDEIKKLDESITPDTNLTINEIKRGQTLWLTALAKKPGTSYGPQTPCVIKARIQEYWWGLNILNTLNKK